jgi:hypothetical protein
MIFENIINHNQVKPADNKQIEISQGHSEENTALTTIDPDAQRRIRNKLAQLQTNHN